ncbi:MAG: RNA 2',3'-cyclic phosphodiesterase [Chloroflexi bacterium]|nr:RNA 2',3'-cyclic phosphodiesterase [Chloroflexota bacterium]
MTELVRSFIAIELPDEIKTALAGLRDELKRGRADCVKWVEPRVIHLTLKFLGNVKAESLGAVAQAMHRAAAEVAPFSVAVTNLGVFPSLRRIRVIWVGLTGDLEELQKLQQAVERHVRPLGFPTEARAFTPHLTIARVREGASPGEQRALCQAVSTTSFPGEHSFAVRDISLMRSQLTRGGAVYSRLESARLGTPPA